VFRLGPVNLSVTQMAVVGITVVLTSIFALLFKFTRLGLYLRATADNVEGATIIGIKTNAVYAVGWGAACFLAVIGGVLVASIQGLVSLSIEGVGLLAFPAVVIGGLDSVPGALVGGLMIGVLQQVVGAYIGISERDAIVFGVLLAFLILRPSGLFGQRAVTRV
jgi:branched-chain amino acid transport system permease protein